MAIFLVQLAMREGYLNKEGFSGPGARRLITLLQS